MVPVFYLIGSVLVRATAKKVIQELAKRGAKRIAASQAAKMKESPINVTIKNLDKIVKPKIVKPKIEKPAIEKPKKATTKQDPKGNAKPTVDKTRTNKRRKTVNNTTANKLNAPKPVKKPSNLPRNAVIVAGIGGAGFLLDKLSKLEVEKNKDKIYKRAKNLNKKPVVSDRVAVKTGTKKAKFKDIPKDTEAILSKIAEPKPKSNLSRFGKAFKNARKQGRYSFMFDGREITTRLKEETVAEHKKKFGKK